MATHLDAGIQVVILARGPSIKLEALTEDTPKPLLPVANRQLLSYQINELHNIGVNSLFFWESSFISTTHTAGDQPLNELTDVQTLRLRARRTTFL